MAKIKVACFFLGHGVDFGAVYFTYILTLRVNVQLMVSVGLSKMN